MKMRKGLTFPELLETIRKEHNFRSWDAMALYIVEHGGTDNDKISRNHIYKWLQGTTPKYSSIKAIATAFNLSEKSIMEICGYEGLNPTTIGNAEISEITGLSYNAIECLRTWKQFSQQACFPGSFNDLDALNTILEYYHEQNKANKGLLPPFSIFHSIGMYLEAPDFDLMSPGGKDTLNNTMDVINHKNKLAHYNIPVAGLVREYVKDKIIDALKNISLHVCKS